MRDTHEEREQHIRLADELANVRDVVDKYFSAGRIGPSPLLGLAKFLELCLSQQAYRTNLDAAVRELVKAASNVHKTANELFRHTEECKHCDPDVNHVCELCYLLAVISELRPALARFKEPQ